MILPTFVKTFSLRTILVIETKKYFNCTKKRANNQNQIMQQFAADSVQVFLIRIIKTTITYTDANKL